jgi:hypothetical protein
MSKTTSTRQVTGGKSGKTFTETVTPAGGDGGGKNSSYTRTDNTTGKSTTTIGPSGGPVGDYTDPNA